MIRFIKFGFRGVGSFGNQWREIPFGVGLTQISGVNGAGKSTLLECLFFALYGQPFQRETITELVSWQNGKKSLEVAVWFARNNQVYKAWRTLSEEKLVKIDTVGNETEMVGFEGKIGFQNEVNRLLGIDADTARRLLFISADDTKPFPELKTAEKRTFIEDYFRLGVIGKMEAMAKNRRSNLQSTLNIQKSAYDRSIPTVEFLEKKLDEETARYNTAVQEHEANIVKEIGKRDQKIIFNDKDMYLLVTDRDNIQSRLDEAKKRENEYIELQEKKASNIIEVAKSEKAVIEERLTSSIALNENISTQIEAVNQKLPSILSKIETDFNELLKAHSEKTEALTANLAIRRNRDDVLTSELASLKKKLVDTRMEHGGVKRLAEVQTRQTQLLKERDILIADKAFLKENSKCVYCKSEITEEHRAMEIEKINNKGRELQTEHGTLESEKQLIEASLKTATEIEQEISIREIEQKELARVLATHEKELSVHINQAPKQSMLDEKIRVAKLEADQTIASYTRQIVDLDKIRMEIDSLMAKAEREASQIRDNAKNEYGAIISSLETKLGLANQTIEQTKKNNDALILSMDGAIFEMQGRTIDRSPIDKVEVELTNARKVRDEYEAQLLSTQKELSIFELGCEVLGDKGVKPFFIKSFVPVLNKKVADLLKWFSLPVHIEFDDQLNMTILNLSSPKEVKYRQHSKGERRRITTAILLSFIDIVSERMGWHCDQMFFDEFLDDGMDATGMESLIDILLNYSERKDTGIVVVSHKAKSESFNRLWWVSKNEEGFSDVAIKE